MSEFMLFFKLGLDHVLDLQAYDHMLFLIVLIVAYTFDSWKSILLLITLFTVGHTTSLLLAVYNVMSVNSGVVEFLIPITILFTAIFNIVTVGKSSYKNRYTMLLVSTVFFGLIHGFAFSRGFIMASKGSDSKILSLLEFALGIEIAQIIVVFFVVFISFIIQTIFRFSKRDWILVVSSIVIGMVIPMIINNYPW